MLLMYYLSHLKTIGPDFFFNLDKNNWRGIFTDYKFFRPDTETGFENKATIFINILIISYKK
jgi:hypothetical protein